MEPSTSQTSPAVPIAIICGFALIALAIFFTGGKNNEKPPTPAEQEVAQTAPNSIRPVDDSDLIRGNPNAPILLVEYSDFDCPFCKQYHNTLNMIMDEYGVTGQVAWVFRPFPLGELHPNGPKIAEAALCVGELGGDQAFWEFSDRVYEDRDVTEFTNVTKLPSYVEELGLSLDEYNNCLKGGQMTERVAASVKDGYNIGARGTPYTILIVGNEQVVINGAQPYDTVKDIIVTVINQLEGNFDAASATTTTPVPKNELGLPVLE